MNLGEREVRELWRRAEDSLSAAEKLVADGYADIAASRAYYAAFHAASALLLSKEGVTYTKHSAVLAHLHKEYIKTGRLPRDVGRIVNALYDIRHIGDYGGPAHVQSEQAEQAIEDARRAMCAMGAFLGTAISGEGS